MSRIARRTWLRLCVAAIASVAFLVLVWFDTRSKWISKREQLRVWIWGHAGSIEDESSVPPAPMPAPWSIRICGETGVAAIILDERKMIRQLPASEDRNPQSVARKVKRLFPEATIRVRDREGRETPFIETPSVSD